MIIVPNSTVWLCSGIPFDLGYRHTKLYSTKAAQFSDISTKAVLTVPNCTYIRNKRAIRVTCPYVTAYGVNYLIFKNTNFENKYFYAFVTGCNYVNNSVFEFTYELDVIQTWMFDYEMRHCFVEREHIANDYIGASRTPEDLEYGDLIVTTQFKDTYSHSYKIGILCSFSVSTNPDGTRFYGLPAGKIVGKTYCGLSLYMFDTAKAANTFLENATTDAQDKGIVSIAMYPASFAEQVSRLAVEAFAFNNSSEVPAAGKSFKESTPFEGYVPKNAKVYQYPFRQLKVTNGRGNCAVFAWENSYFGAEHGVASKLSFLEFVGGYNNPEIILSPVYYNWNSLSASDYYAVNAMQSMTNGGAIPCSWTSDAYKAWLAQNAGQLMSVNYAYNTDEAAFARNQERGRLKSGAEALRGGVNSGLSAGINSGSAGAGIALGMANAIGDFAMSEYDRETDALNFRDSQDKRLMQMIGVMRDHSVLPPHAHQVTTSGQLAMDCDLSGFTFYCCSCRSDYAQIADQYFTMYGYAVNQIKKPNLHTRQNYNYIKTSGFAMQSALPASDAKMISSIFDTGITFWHCALDSIGNYNLENGSVT